MRDGNSLLHINSSTSAGNNDTKGFHDEEKSDKGKNLLSFEEKDSLLSDLFSGKDGQLNSSFLYRGKGADLYEKISKDKKYPFIDIEISYLENLKHDPTFQKILKTLETIVDVGAGDGQKAIALLLWTSWNGIYIPEDYSSDMLEIAKTNIKNMFKYHNQNLKLGASQLLTEEGEHVTKNCPRSMYLFLGGTICNMTDEKIIEALKNMTNNGTFVGNKILLTYYTAPDTEEEINNLIDIYNSESNRAFHENGMAMLGLSKNDFEFDTVYEKDNPSQKKGPFPGRIKGIIRAKRDCVVRLSNGEEIMIKKGKEFTLHYSRRFSKESISELFKKSGCNIKFNEDITREKDGIKEKTGVSAVLLSKNPTKIGNYIEKNKKFLISVLSALVIGTGIGFTVNAHTKYQQKQTQEKLNTVLAMHNLGQKGEHPQETNELVAALKLIEINKKDRQTIIDLFNKYIDDHKEEELSTERLIQKFWGEYGWILVNDHGVTHEPYDFITYDLIECTRKINGELSVTTHGVLSNNRIELIGFGGLDYGVFTARIKKQGGSRILKYSDGSKKYLILKVKAYLRDKQTEIYVGAEDKGNEYYPDFSTDIINEIQDKSGLDSEIISNTYQLGGNFKFQRRINRDGIDGSGSSTPLTLANTNEDMILKTAHMDNSPINVNLVYVGGKLYYFIIVPTASGKHVGLASESLEGTYSTTKFNEISKDFDTARMITGYNHGGCKWK